MKDAINWFELPVVNLARAQAFYEAVLGTPLKAEVFEGTPIAIFPGRPGVTGCLVQDARRTPSASGSLVYLNATGKLEGYLTRVEAAGGKVVQPKTDIGPQGQIAIILDTEGNSVGLHAARS